VTYSATGDATVSLVGSVWKVRITAADSATTPTNGTIAS
jgi:hypothetical protein